MAYRKRKRLSAWAILARLGHAGDDHDDLIEHVFNAASRVTLRSDNGEPLDGDDFLVSVFESLGTSKTWPTCGSPEWERLRTVALRRVVARLSREGLLDAIAVGSATDVKDGEEGDDKPDVAAWRWPTKTSNTMLQVSEPAAKDEGSVADAFDSGETSTVKDCEHDSDLDEVETSTTDDGSIDPRIGVQVFRSYIRRGQRNPDGWFRGVDRMTPYKVIARWASQTCPGVATESLVALLDGLREVRWWDDDGHIIGGEMLAVLESELEAGCGRKQWVRVVSDFEDAIRRLRGVLEKLCLL